MRAALATGPGPSEAPAGSGSRRLTERVFRIRESGIIVVLAMFVGVTAAIQPRFAGSQEIQFILANTTVFALLALGETMVVISRNVDLSIGSVLGLSAYLSAGLFGAHPGIPIPVVFLAGLGIGLACGVANGLMVSIGKVPSLVVTLATLYIIRGIDILIVGGNEVVAQTLPNAFIQIPKANIAGIPYLAIAIAAVVGAGAYYLRSFRSGRELYAIGSNPEAARLAGIPVGRRVFTAFAASGAIAGVAGVLWAAQYQTIDSTAGTGYELQVIAAVVVGGVAIFGGSGSAVGAAIGALLLNTINSALYVLGISPFWDQAIAGFLLLVAIALDRAISVRLAGPGLRATLHGVRWVSDARTDGTARWDPATGRVTARLTVRYGGGTVRLTARWLLFAAQDQPAVITGTAGSRRLAATMQAP
jgi:rhamnose transport system permease protein